MDQNRIVMNELKKYSLFLLVFVMFWSCEDETYEVEYQAGYPNLLAGNWIAFDFAGGVFDPQGNFDGPYDLVTALDPNSNDSLVLSNIYDSGVRVKAKISGQTFRVDKGNQLEVINNAQHGIHYVSIEGEVVRATKDDERDIIVLLVGLYDQRSAQVDSVFIYGYRKNGFENIDEQNFN